MKLKIFFTFLVLTPSGMNLFSMRPTRKEQLLARAAAVRRNQTDVFRGEEKPGFSFTSGTSGEEKVSKSKLPMSKKLFQQKLNEVEEILDQHKGKQLSLKDLEQLQKNLHLDEDTPVEHEWTKNELRMQVAALIDEARKREPTADKKEASLPFVPTSTPVSIRVEKVDWMDTSSDEERDEEFVLESPFGW